MCAWVTPKLHQKRSNIATPPTLVRARIRTNCTFQKKQKKIAKKQQKIAKKQQNITIEKKKKTSFNREERRFVHAKNQTDLASHDLQVCTRILVRHYIYHSCDFPTYTTITVPI